MNLPCILGMIVCSPLPEASERSFRVESHAESPINGESLLQELEGKDGRDRELQLLAWFQAGQWPLSQSRFRAVHVREGGHHLVYWVSRDYLRLGSDQDSVLMPLAWTTLRELLKSWHLLVPSAKMVDQIYQQSERIHWPHAYPPSDAMRSTETLREHNAWIAERPGWDLFEAPLEAGHKKDLIVSARLLALPKKLAIYGWHNLGNGAAIQPQSLWHGEFYVDYSHGIRLVAPEAELDGKPISLAKIWNDPLLAKLISFEGAYDVCAVLRYDCY